MARGVPKGVGVKERPILFSDALVRAILEGRKVETRRPIAARGRAAVHLKQATEAEGYTGDGSCLRGAKDALVRWCCPFGAPGDRLWIRECWGIGSRPDPFEGCVDGIEYRADVAYLVDEHDSLPLYRVDTPEDVCIGDYVRKGWRPSIHMPRWASRITLDIMSIGVERVQDITEEGARREGFERNEWPARENFARAWDAIYGNWEASPWVWVVAFKVAEVKR